MEYNNGKRANSRLKDSKMLSLTVQLSPKPNLYRVWMRAFCNVKLVTAFILFREYTLVMQKGREIG